MKKSFMNFKRFHAVALGILLMDDDAMVFIYQDYCGFVDAIGFDVDFDLTASMADWCIVNDLMNQPNDMVFV